MTLFYYRYGHCNPIRSLYIVFSEENILGNDDPTCLVKDSILVEFLKRPSPDAGDDETNICGNCVQAIESLCRIFRRLLWSNQN